MSDDLEAMRLKVASAHGFDPYLTYTEKQVAGFLKKDTSTLKRWRKKGIIPFNKMGEKLISYLGSDVAEFLLGKRSSAWQGTQSESSKSANTGSPNGKAVPHGTARGSTAEPLDVHHLAQTRFQKPKPN